MDWFERLVGFREGTRKNVERRLSMDGTMLCSSETERTYDCGEFSWPSLSQLRETAARELTSTPGSIRLREVVADVRDLHNDPANAGATFQVASQFNFLEMVAPQVTPDHGVTRYELDGTQGPACAISCGAATIYRNYFVTTHGRPGQTAKRQLDGLAEIGEALGNNNKPLWDMRNGYALLTAYGRATLPSQLRSMSSTDTDTLRGLLRVGVHDGAQVTAVNAAPSQRVHQVFGSAMPVSYGSGTDDEWRAIAKLVLEASYEAVLLKGALNASSAAGRPLYLTKLGGGVFGNDPRWITAAIDRALAAALPLLNSHMDVVIVSYGRPDKDFEALIERWS